MRTTGCDKGVSQIYNVVDLPVGGRCHPSGARYVTIAEAEAAVQQHASGQTRNPGRPPMPQSRCSKVTSSEERGRGRMTSTPRRVSARAVATALMPLSWKRRA